MKRDIYDLERELYERQAPVEVLKRHSKDPNRMECDIVIRVGSKKQATLLLERLLDFFPQKRGNA